MSSLQAEVPEGPPRSPAAAEGEERADEEARPTEQGGGVEGKGPEGGEGPAAPRPGFVESTSFTGSRDGYYFRLGDKGIGYYLDVGFGGSAHDGENRSEPAPLTDVQKQTADFERVGGEGGDTKPYTPANVKMPQSDPRVAGLSKKQIKKMAKMTPEQLVLVGYAGIDFKAILAGTTVPAEESTTQAAGAPLDDLDPSVKATIAAQKRKYSEDPQGHRGRYDSQKATPGFSTSNTQRQDIYMMYKDDKAKVRRIEKREERQRTAHIKKNKPAWL